MNFVLLLCKSEYSLIDIKLSRCFMKKAVFLMLVIPLFLSCKKDVRKAVYEGEDISQSASIVRNKDTKQADLSINVDGTWTLYAGKSTDAIDYSHSYTGSGKGIFPLDVNDSIRSYFQLITDNGKAILAERHLPMAGGFNFRDLGGIKTKEGKYVKWGKFFRTDELSDLTDADLSYLKNIPIVSVVDFRTKSEIELKPDKLPVSVKKHYEMNISPGNLDLKGFDLNQLAKLNIDSVMIAMNEALVTDSVIIDTYKQFFGLLQEESNLPLIFHCTAGKDRTGMGAALILFALGVDEATVMKDYLSSNIYLKDKYAKMIEERPFLEPMFTVKKEYLQTSIDLIKEKYGSVDNYLTNQLNVDIPKFREMYLY